MKEERYKIAAQRRSPSVDTLCRILAAAGFEVRMRLAAPDAHDDTREITERLVPAGQLAAHTEREDKRVARRLPRTAAR